MAYKSKYTGQRIDELLSRIENGDLDITIDTVLSETSNNAVANSAVTNAIVSLGDAIDGLGEKADADGYYPNMSVGMADNLVGRGDVQDAHIGFRPTAGADNITDGAARIEKIKGNSVVWNQAVSNADFRNGTEGWGSILADIYAQDGYMEFVIKEIGSSQFNHYFAKTLAKGHKYIIMCDMERDTTDIYPFIVYFGNGTGKFDIFWGEGYSSDKRHIATAIITTTYEIPLMLIYPTIDAPTGTKTNVYSVQVIDLTHMFGVGNEPTTYEEYLQRKPMNIADEFAYNAGEIIDMHANELVSTGDNAYNPAEKKAYVMPNAKYHITDSANSEYLDIIFSYYDADGSLIFDADFDIVEEDGKTYYLFPQAGWVEVNMAQGNICVCLSHSYDKPHPAYQQDVKDLSFIGEAFPEGMRSAGSAYDEIRFNPTKKVWEKVTRIGVVDLGSLNWHKDLEGFNGYYSMETPKPKPAVGFSGMCDRYPYQGSYIDVVDKTSGYIYNDCVFVKDATFTDEEDCKQKLSGVRLLYELAEPIVEEIDLSPSTNLDYLVWDFGTEEAIVPSNAQSALFRADIQYGDNFVDDIRSNKRAIASNKASIENNTAAINELQAKATPSGDPMHYMYESLGAKWNANTGYWEFYDMIDITNEQMSKAFARGSWYAGPSAVGVLAAFNPQSLNAIRFNFARTGAWGIGLDMDYFADSNSYIEFVNMTHDNNLVAMPYTYVAYLKYSFNGCENLRRIYGELELSNVDGVQNAFNGCKKLESVLLYGLKDSISFAESPLSVESATYMIANANASSSFTITFRADRQEIFEANSDFIAAKSAKPNITILYQ